MKKSISVAQFKGVKIIAVRGGYQVVGQTKVYKRLLALTDTLQ